MCPRQRPRPRGIGQCAGMVGRRHTPFGCDGRLIRCSLVAASNCEGMRVRRKWSDVRRNSGLADVTPRLVSANRTRWRPRGQPSSITPPFIQVYPTTTTTTWDCAISLIYHGSGSTIEREVKPGEGPTLSKQPGPTSRPYLTCN